MDEAAEAAKRKKAELEAEIELVKKEYEEKLRKKGKSKAKKEEKNEKSKETEKEDSKKEDEASKKIEAERDDKVRIHPQCSSQAFIAFRSKLSPKIHLLSSTSDPESSLSTSMPSVLPSAQLTSAEISSKCVWTGFVMLRWHNEIVSASKIR